MKVAVRIRALAPALMGCLESKPQASAAPVGPTADERRIEEAVVNVARAPIAVGDRERAELKLKTLRDRLHARVVQCEAVLRADGKLAVQMRKEGLVAEARLLVLRRRAARERIGKSEGLLSVVVEMIDGMDRARDNVKVVQALDRGTVAINNVMEGMSVERVRKALEDGNDAVAYVKEVGEAFQEEGLTDEQFEKGMAEIDEELQDWKDEAMPQVANAGVRISQVAGPAIPTPVHSAPRAVSSSLASDLSSENELRRPVAIS